MKLPKDYLNNKDFLDYKIDFKKEEVRSFEEYQNNCGYELEPIWASDEDIYKLYLEDLKKKK